jgi:hypothetical protein
VSTRVLLSEVVPGLAAGSFVLGEILVFVSHPGRLLSSPRGLGVWIGWSAHGEQFTYKREINTGLARFPINQGDWQEQIASYNIANPRGGPDLF